MNPLMLLAAWSVLSLPAAFAVGAVLNAAGRRTARPGDPAPVRARAHRAY